MRLNNYYLNYCIPKQAFPKILICSNSLHSKKRIQEKYPNLTNTLIASLYGFNRSQLSADEIESVAGIDMLTFYRETRSELLPIECSFNKLNCLHVIKDR